MIVDEQPADRDRLAAALRTGGDLAIVAEAGSAEVATALAEQARPDVLLLDAQLPGADDVVTTVSGLGGTPVRVLVLTSSEPAEHVFAALRAGASGYLRKESQPRTLIEAVHLVADGEGVGDPVVTSQLVGAYAQSSPPGRYGPAVLDQLTERELDVLRLAARGLSNAEVAAELVLSTSTVKTHMNAILGKLKLRDRVQATIVAYETGLIRPGADPGAGWTPPQQ
jgi:DNA-binding NarL/FixJ family response regulator